MDISQVSVFLENRSGGLAEVIDVLATHAIDIEALALADMADFGVLRLIVADPERARAALKEAGFTADRTRVVAVEVPDRAGGLRDTLHALRRSGINVEYMYSAARRRGERAIIVLRVDEVGRTEEALRGAGITVLDRFEPL